MMWHKRKRTHKWQYSQEEIAEQIGQISELMNMRDRTSHAENKRFAESIEVSQEVLAFMLDEVRRQHGRK